MSVREVCPEGDAYDRWLHQLTDDCPGCAEFARVHDPELWRTGQGLAGPSCRESMTLPVGRDIRISGAVQRIVTCAP